MPENEPSADRGGGIHVSQGGFRIRNLSLSIDASTGDMADSSMTVELRTDTFHHWLRIAEEACDDAAKARTLAVETSLEDNEGFNAALQREFQASMISISAAAFAIDSFYLSVLQHAPDTKVDAGSRDGAIFETLKRAFGLTTAQQSKLREPLRILFRLRNEAVHPPAAWREPARHPVFNLGMEPRFVNYVVENATNGQLLARQLTYFCLQKPNPKYAELVEWCEALKDVVDEPPGTR